MSREHLVSASFFPGKMVMVQGFPWCKDKAVEIGVASLTSKILCEKHNSDLSPLDQAASGAADTLRAVHELHETRKQLKRNIWKVKQFAIDGALLERWFLKTLINLASGREYPIGRDSEIPGQPSARLVRTVFGREAFEGKAGLYVLAKEGMTLTMEDRVQCLTLINDKKYLEGGLFGFRGFGFLLQLEPEGPRASLAGISFGGQDLGGAKLLFRDSWFRTRVGKYESHALHIKW